VRIQLGTYFDAMPICIECGSSFSSEGPTIGLHVPTGDGYFQSLGFFCPTCQERFCEIGEGSEPLSVSLDVDEQALKAAMSRSAERLQRLAKNLSGGEVPQE
jgi:hypothetical protein